MFYTVSQINDIWESTCVLKMHDLKSLCMGPLCGYSHQESVLQDGMQHFKVAMHQARLYKPLVAP